jgi:hypothetical protein
VKLAAAIRLRNSERGCAPRRVLPPHAVLLLILPILSIHTFTTSPAVAEPPICARKRHQFSLYLTMLEFDHGFDADHF